MASLINATSALAAHFSVSEAFAVIKPLSLYIVAMVVYAVFIFKFYKFIARRDIFNLKLGKWFKEKKNALLKIAAVPVWIIERFVAFPIFLFFWMIVLTTFLTFMSKNGGIQSIMLLSVTLVAAIRITAYYTEDLSKDLAKILPFAMLGILLVDMSYFSFSTSWVMLKQLPVLWKSFVYYWLFILILEIILRGVYLVIKPFMSKEK